MQGQVYVADYQKTCMYYWIPQWPKGTYVDGYSRMSSPSSIMVWLGVEGVRQAYHSVVTTGVGVATHNDLFLFLCVVTLCWGRETETEAETTSSWSYKVQDDNDKARSSKIIILLALLPFRILERHEHAPVLSWYKQVARHRVYLPSNRSGRTRLNLHSNRKQETIRKSSKVRVRLTVSEDTRIHGTVPTSRSS